MKNLPKIEYETIEHKSQRYATAGDYFKDGDVWKFRVSNLGNARYEFLVLIHEQIEWFLTQLNGITEEDITKFDIESGLDDPGASSRAPYHKEHMFAESIERILCDKLGIDWNIYDESFNKLK